MNRGLIVAGERQTGERYQQALAQEGFQTAVVWNPIQMVEFCRQHTPDFMVVDLDLAELGLWSAIQAVRGIGTLANVPFFGLARSRSRAKVTTAPFSHWATKLGGASPMHPANPSRPFRENSSQWKSCPDRRVSRREKIPS